MHPGCGAVITTKHDQFDGRRTDNFEVRELWRDKDRSCAFFLFVKNVHTRPATRRAALVR